MSRGLGDVYKRQPPLQRDARNPLEVDSVFTLIVSLKIFDFTLWRVCSSVG